MQCGGKILFYSRDLSLFFLLRPLADQMRFIHMIEVNLLYLKSANLNADFI